MWRPRVVQEENQSQPDEAGPEQHHYPELSFRLLRKWRLSRCLTALTRSARSVHIGTFEGRVASLASCFASFFAVHRGLLSYTGVPRIDYKDPACRVNAAGPVSRRPQVPLIHGFLDRSKPF